MLVKMESQTNGHACVNSSVDNRASLEKKVGETFLVFSSDVFFRRLMSWLPFWAICPSMRSFSLLVLESELLQTVPTPLH